MSFDLWWWWWCAPTHVHVHSHQLIHNAVLFSSGPSGLAHARAHAHAVIEMATAWPGLMPIICCMNGVQMLPQSRPAASYHTSFEHQILVNKTCIYMPAHLTTTARITSIKLNKDVIRLARPTFALIWGLSSDRRERTTTVGGGGG